MKCYAEKDKETEMDLSEMNMIYKNQGEAKEANVLDDVLDQNVEQRVHTVSHVNSRINSSDSEAESLHSVDTAGYIRASRRRIPSTSGKSSSPMTTIKMYRTLPRKRAELRAKYGCDGFNEDLKLRHHMRALLYRRNQMLRWRHERDLSIQTGARQCSLSSKGRRRRKQLRKRRDTSPMYSSSSEDDRNCSRKTVYLCCRNRNYHSHRVDYFDYHCKLLKMEARTYEEQLHDKTRLITSSSTESWMLENKRCKMDSTNHCKAIQKSQSHLDKNGHKVEGVEHILSNTPKPMKQKSKLSSLTVNQFPTDSSRVPTTQGIHQQTDDLECLISNDPNSSSSNQQTMISSTDCKSSMETHRDSSS